MKASATADFLHRARYRPEVIILDPPRTGALDLMEPIIKLRAPSVIYVSCDVTTLARDLRVLADARYKINRVRGVRFFPQHASCGDRGARAIDLDRRAFLE